MAAAPAQNTHTFLVSMPMFLCTGVQSFHRSLLHLSHATTLTERLQWLKQKRALANAKDQVWQLLKTSYADICISSQWIYTDAPDI
eukprot:23692-Chlamydomonas_euryale.AAC.7